MSEDRTRDLWLADLSHVTPHYQCEFCHGCATRLVMKEGFRVCLNSGLCISATAFEHMLASTHAEDPEG